MQIPKTPAPPPPEPPPPSKPVPMTERVALFLRTRKKPTLPPGYQFGDAGRLGCPRCLAGVPGILSDPMFHCTLCDGTGVPKHWNTIEGDPLDTPEHIDSDAVEGP